MRARLRERLIDVEADELRQTKRRDIDSPGRGAVVLAYWNLTRART